MRSSAGILLYKRVDGRLLVLLVHPGGPFWASKDDGAWSIPKGEFSSDEDPMAAARREFAEELGTALNGDLLSLGEAVQGKQKRIISYASEGDLDVATVRSNLFEMEWPPRSGQVASFPEIDRACWYTLSEGRRKLLRDQVVFLDRLEAVLDAKTTPQQ